MPDLFAPECRIVPRLQHSHPKSEREAGNYLSVGERQFSVSNTALNQFQIIHSVMIEQIQIIFVFPPVAAILLAKSMIYCVAKGNLDGLNGDVKRFSKLCVPHIELQGSRMVVSGSDEICLHPFV